MPYYKFKEFTRDRHVYDESNKSCHRQTILDTNTLSIFRDSRIYMSTPRQLNDVFDVNIAMINNLAPNLNSDFVRDNLDFFQTLVQIITSMSVSGDNVSEFIQENIVGWLSEGIFDRTRVQCMSFSPQQANGFSVNEEVLMWSHYTDNHSGICLQFDFDAQGSDSTIHDQFNPIVYTNEYPDLLQIIMRYRQENRNKDWRWVRENFILPLLITKRENWHYEAERRLTFIQGGDAFTSLVNVTAQSLPIIDVEEVTDEDITTQQVFLRFDPMQLTNVYFGINVQQDLRDQFIQFIRTTRDGEFGHVQFWQGDYHNTRFEVEFSQINL